MKRTLITKLKVLLVLLAFGAASCGEENPDDLVTPVDPQSGCRLTELREQGDDEVTKVEYNAQGNISKVTETGRGDTDIIAYTYDANNRLIKVEQTNDSDNDYSAYEYTNGLVSAIKEYDGGVLESTITLKYDANKRLIELTEDLDDDIYKVTFEYDNKGNVTKSEAFFDNMLSRRRVFENYDDKKTPLSAVPGLVEPSAMASKNNPGKETVQYFTDQDGNGQVDAQPYDSRVTTYTYEYNSNGFPTKITQSEAGGRSYIQLYTYNCK